MLSAFLNPATLTAGALLVSAPIIIHLINRIRFQRVKWAAMEFLLKAQKRMRRRKILEQLILLLLRCLLVFLVGWLFARFTGFNADAGKDTRPTAHVIILDDTPSMADKWSPENGGAETTAFDEGKRLISEKLVPATAEAQAAQTVAVIRLSDLEYVFPAATKEVTTEEEATKAVERKKVPKPPEDLREEGRVNGASIAALQDALGSTLRVSTVRRTLLAGLQKAKTILELAPPGDARVVHVVSDLRAVDWAAEGGAIQELLRDYKDAGIALHLIDVANPARKPDRKNPPFNDNISIVEVRPMSRLVSVDQPVQIDVRVRNNGGGELRNLGISFYTNGQRDIPIKSVSIPYIPANQERTISVSARFQKPSDDDKAKLGSALSRFRLITAVLTTPERGGLAIDNARHTVVEVRDALKVLVVDGRTVVNGVDQRLSSKGDSAYLRTLLTAEEKQSTDESLGKIDVVSGDFGKLDKIDLRPFSTVYLMNVPTLSDAAVKNLESFVARGGGVGVFLGPDVKPEDYKQRMYRGGTGFFPVPLEPEPSKELTAEEKLFRGLASARSLTPRLMLRTSALRTHPAIKGMYTEPNGDLTKDNKVERAFLLPLIERYWPVARRGPWREDKDVQELYCLPNEASIGSFEAQAVDLVNAVKARYNEPKFEKARKYLDPLLKSIREKPATSEPLSELARLLDELLCDQINTGDESEPVLREFWAQPELASLKTQATDLRDATKYGPPLYLAKQFGRGRVAVMTTDASGTHSGDTRWNNWASGEGAYGWSILVSQMHKYLASGGDETNRSVGDRFTADFEFARFMPTGTVHRLTAEALNLNGEGKIPWDVKELKPASPLLDRPAKAPGAPADAPEPPLRLSFGETDVPGVYVFTIPRKQETGGVGGAKPDPNGDLEFLAVPFNVDALNEGDLHRANTDDLAALTNKAPLHNTEDLSWIDALKQKPTDLSSRRWLYLLILLVLIAEQAWAVRLSYHTKPEDLDMLAPSAAAAFAHHSTPTPASSGEAA